MYHAKANEECIILVDRLKQYISLQDACNYIGIHIFNLTKMKNVEPPKKWLPEQERDENYHLGKIKLYVKNGVSEPIDVDCLSQSGRIKPFPVILDGRHRYIAALIRGDKTISAVFSGLPELMDYLTGKTNRRPGV